MRQSILARRTIALRIKTALRRLGRGLLIVIAAQLFAVPVQADSETVNEVAKLLPGDVAADDLFGQKVAIDGDTAVIASYGDDELGPYTGAVYVFTRNETGSWDETQKLLPSGVTSFSGFGFEVAIFEDTILATATSRGGDDVGVVYVFERGSSGEWGEAQILGGDVDDYTDFGNSLAIVGDYAFVGAPYEDTQPEQNDNHGAVYVFERGSSGTWNPLQKLKASDAGFEHFFGSEIAYDGERVVIVATGDSRSVDSSGSAYVFEQDTDGTWFEAAKLEPSDALGTVRAVAIDGITILLGAREGDASEWPGGVVYSFTEVDGGEWLQSGKLRPREPSVGNLFGDRITVKDGIAVIAAMPPVGANYYCNFAYVFTQVSHSFWGEQAQLVASDPDLCDSTFPGVRLAFQDDFAILGATQDDSNGPFSGAAYIFDVKGIDGLTTRTFTSDGGVFATRFDHGPVDVEFRQWRQLTDTVGLSQLQIGSACDQVTGVCNGSVGDVDLTGWIWASPEDVKELFEFLNQYKYLDLEGPEIDRSSSQLYLLQTVGGALTLFPRIFDTTFIGGENPFDEDGLLISGDQGVAGWTREAGVAARILNDLNRRSLSDFFLISGRDTGAGLSGIERADTGHWLYKPLAYGTPSFIDFEDVEVRSEYVTVESRDFEFEAWLQGNTFSFISIREAQASQPDDVPRGARARDSQHLFFLGPQEVVGLPRLEMERIDGRSFNLHQFSVGVDQPGAPAPNNIEVIGTRSDGSIVTGEARFYAGDEYLWKTFLGSEFSDLVQVEFVGYFQHPTLLPEGEPRSYVLDALEVSLFVDNPTLELVAVNDGPFSVDEGGSISPDESILDNDTVPNPESTVAVLVDPPSRAASFALAPDGQFEYTHDGSETVSDSFTYRANDGSSQSDLATVTLEIILVNDAPVITLLGSNPLVLEVGDDYEEPGATAEDAEDGDLTSSIVIEGSVDTNTAGTYIVTYRVEDASGNQVSAERTVIVEETTPQPTDQPPVITLIGSPAVTVTEGDQYVDQGATARDAEDGDLTSEISVNNPVDTGRPGTYTVSYTVEDSAGNTATAERSVTVEAATAPVDEPPTITVIGAATVTITEGDVYVDEGAIATDAEDGDLTDNIIVENSVDSGTPGTYTVTYSVKDSGGNVARAERTVIVEAAAPVSPPTDSGGGGGGGSTSPYDLFVLLVIALGLRSVRVRQRSLKAGSTDDTKALTC